MIKEILNEASYGIVSLFEVPWVFVILLAFLLWISIYDIKTKTIKNYQNISFLLVGLLLFVLEQFGVVETGLSLGWGHLIGYVVGFLLLFIPGMVLNFAYGGDIKFVAALGFWVGGISILMIMVVATIAQFVFLLLYYAIRRNFDKTVTLPYAPAFSIGFAVLLTLYTL